MDFLSGLLVGAEFNIVYFFFTVDRVEAAQLLSFGHPVPFVEGDSDGTANKWDFWVPTLLVTLGFTLLSSISMLLKDAPMFAIPASFKDIFS